MRQCKSANAAVPRAKVQEGGGKWARGPGDKGCEDRDSAKVQIGAELLCKCAKVDSRNT